MGFPYTELLIAVQKKIRLYSSAALFTFWEILYSHNRYANKGIWTMRDCVYLAALTFEFSMIVEVLGVCSPYHQKL